VRHISELVGALPVDEVVYVPEALIKRLQNQCVEASERLMADLFKLDGLLSSTPAERQQRKEQVLAVQKAMDSIDDMKNRLEHLREIVRQHRSEQEKKKESPKTEGESSYPSTETKTGSSSSPPTQATKFAEPEVTPAPAPTAAVPAPALATVRAASTPEQQHPTTRDVVRKESSPHDDSSTHSKPPVEGAVQVRAPYTVGGPNVQQVLGSRGLDLQKKLQRLVEVMVDEEKWRSLRMEPQFQVDERWDHFSIRGLLPHLRKDDVKVETNRQSIVIAGTRLPRKDEVREMMASLLSVLESGRVDAGRLLSLEEDQLLQILGSGQYGSFRKSYSLPPDADVERVSANYEGGVLIVKVWKKRQSLFATKPVDGLFGHPSLFFPQRTTPNLLDLFW